MKAPELDYLDADRVNAPDDVSSNTSGNRPFRDILQTAASRRHVLGGSLAAAATGFLAPQALAQDPFNVPGRFPGNNNRGLVNFSPVTIEQATVDQSLPTISDDYEYQTFIP